jgi:prepilin-type N-terminal cleavage/methylation domain-containing protein
VNRFNHTCVPVRRGFSLVEVLIAVLIMAIGLLGLGAVIPVVVREQRLAADATAGVSVSGLARDVIQQRLTNAPNQASLNAAVRERVSAIDVWLDDDQWSPDFLWHPWGQRGNTSATIQIHPAPPQNVVPGSLREARQFEHRFDQDDGSFYWRYRLIRQRRDASSWTNEAGALFEQRLTARDRLWPSPAVLGAGGGQNHRPQFVWDFVARRVESDLPFARRRVEAPAEIEIAIFVRRIDLNIRLAQNVTLFQALTDPSLPLLQRRLPVAVDRSGVPTGNGTNGDLTGNPVEAAYAVPLTMDAEWDPSDATRRTLVLRGGTNERLRLASQIGQRLVDNLGHTYTVRESRINGIELIVQVDPPVANWVPQGTAINRPTIRQVVFTPQIPAAVSVFRITRPVIQP